MHRGGIGKRGEHNGYVRCPEKHHGARGAGCKPYLAAAGGETKEEINEEWILDLECSFFEMFHWSLYDVDRTDIESLLPFVFHYPQWKKKSKNPTSRQMYIDQVGWL
jgi:hypothetical protein